MTEEEIRRIVREEMRQRDREVRIACDGIVLSEDYADMIQKSIMQAARSCPR